LRETSQETAWCILVVGIWNVVLIILWILWTGASAVSGFFASACSLPFDYVKTQIQKMQPGPDGKFPYTGSLDCAMQTLKTGGPLKFYSGFGTYCVRIAPHVMMTWILLNQIQKLEKNIGL
jgi:solute carrier family 25 oxoglutarate transporter 11